MRNGWLLERSEELLGTFIEPLLHPGALPSKPLLNANFLDERVGDLPLVEKVVASQVARSLVREAGFTDRWFASRTCTIKSAQLVSWPVFAIPFVLEAALRLGADVSRSTARIF